MKQGTYGERCFGMFEKLRLTAIAAVAGLALAAPASAAVVSVSGPLSSLGAAAQIIATPGEVFTDALTSNGIVAFNEVQGMTLPVSLNTNNGVVAAGTRVDSHIVFMNGVTGNKLTHGTVADPVEILFSGPILGVITNMGGIGLSSGLLGLVGPTTYASPFQLIGLEGHDHISFLGSTLSLALKTWKPGDWIRVVTAAPALPAVPLPAAGLLLIGGLGGLAALRRTRKTVTA
jgi:hypothetical protein